MMRKRSQTDRRVVVTEKYVGHPLPETIQECESDENVDQIATSPYGQTGVSRTDSPELRISTRSSLTDNRRVPLSYTGANRRQRLIGSATERSSIYSFGDDEFERESSLSVQKLFDDVDLILFERSTNGPTQLRSECNDWISIFPHLRVVGRTKVPVQEFGYKFFESNEDSDLTPRNTDDLLTPRNTDDLLSPRHTDDLSVTQQFIARGICAKVHCFIGVGHRFNEPHSCDGSESDSEFLDKDVLEEVFVQEGLVEEVLAIDTRPSGEDGSGCLQREVLQNLFNETWTEVINGLEELLGRHVQRVFSQASGHSIPGLLDPFHHSLYPSTRDMFLTRESTTLSSTRQTAPDRISRQYSNMSSLNRKLEEVLKISSKALQVRDRNFSHDLSDCPLTRPSSSGPPQPLSGRPCNPRVINEYSPSSRSRIVAGRGKLNPISSRDQIKVFTSEDEKPLDLSHEVIRGYRITTVNNRIALVSSPSPPSTTSTLRPPTRPLPPISRDSRLSAGYNNVFRRKSLIRVRSAVPNKAGAHNHDSCQERTWASSSSSSSGDSSQPQLRIMNTTTATDHPFVFGVNKRSSTTLGFNSLIGHQNQLTETVGGVLVKGQRKWNGLGNQIPEYDEGDVEERLSDVVRISSNFSFGRRAGQHDQHFNTAIR